MDEKVAARRPLSRRNKRRLITCLELILFVVPVSALGITGATSSGTTFEQFRWKSGLYLQISLTVLALLVVFVSQLRLRKIEELESLRRYFEKGGNAALDSYICAHLPKLFDSVLEGARRDAPKGQDMSWTDKLSAQMKKEVESVPGFSAAKRQMDRQLSDDNLKLSLRYCLIVFVILAVVSLTMVAVLEPMARDPTVSNSFSLAVLGAMDGMMLVGTTSLGFLIYNAFVSFIDLNPGLVAFQEFLDVKHLQEREKKQGSSVEKLIRAVGPKAEIEHEVEADAHLKKQPP